MKLIGGNPIWTKINKVYQRYNSLNEDIICDVLIVGGGITGAICSYFLSKEGINCTLIEQDLIGTSSTAACTSLLQYEIDLDIIGLSKKIGEENSKKAFLLCKDAINDLSKIVDENDLDCLYMNVPSLYYTNNREDYFDMSKECYLRRSIGFDVKFIDNKNFTEYCPFPIESGILSSHCSALIDPYIFTVDLLNVANLKGVNIYEKTKIKDFVNSDGMVTCTTIDGYSIKSKKILICTGYNASSLFKEPICTFTRSFNIVTSPLNLNSQIWYKNMMMKDNKEFYTYIRTTQDNRIIIGGEDISQLSYDKNKIENAYNNLENKLKKLFPMFNGYTIDFRYNGIFANTEDSLPYIGEHPDFKNHYFCLGYGSNGILYSILGAQMISKLYKGESVPNLELFKFRR